MKTVLKSECVFFKASLASLDSTSNNATTSFLQNAFAECLISFLQALKRNCIGLVDYKLCKDLCSEMFLSNYPVIDVWLKLFSIARAAMLL